MTLGILFVDLLETNIPYLTIELSLPIIVEGIALAPLATLIVLKKLMQSILQ